eukprot:scaffold76189_cov13-Tisochrysis_lutea.AAC.1
MQKVSVTKPDQSCVNGIKNFFIEAGSLPEDRKQGKGPHQNRCRVSTVLSSVASTNPRPATSKDFAMS